MANNITALAYIHKISNANENLLRKELNLFNPTYTDPKVRKLQMTVNKDCFIIINGSRIKVLASLGLCIDYDDFIIESMIMETRGVSVYAILGY